MSGRLRHSKNRTGRRSIESAAPLVLEFKLQSGLLPHCWQHDAACCATGRMSHALSDVHSHARANTHVTAHPMLLWSATRKQVAAAAAAAAAQQEAEAAAAASSFTAGSMGSFAGPPAVPTLDTRVKLIINVTTLPPRPGCSALPA